MNWLTIAVICFFMMMFLWGYKRGLVKMVISITASVMTLVFVIMVHDPLEEAIRYNTKIYEQIESGVSSYVDRMMEQDSIQSSTTTEGFVNALPLPEILKAEMIKSDQARNSAQSIVKGRGYVINWLTGLIFSAFICVVAFVGIRILFFIGAVLLETIFSLPILRQINNLSGALVGLAMAMLLIWVAGWIITAGATNEWGQEALRLIEESQFLSFLYNNNWLMNMIL